MSYLYHTIQNFARKEADTDLIRSKKILILILAIACSICGFFWTILYFAVFGFGLTMILPLAFVIIVGSMIFISHYFKNHHLLVYTQLFCITWISALIQWSIGSMDSSGLVIAWSFLGPLGAVILLSTREALLWMGMFIIIIVTSTAYEPMLLGYQLKVSENTRMLFYIMNIGASSFVVFSASAWFVNTIQYERGRVENLLQKIKTLFGQHVSSEVADELIAKDIEKSESKFYDVTIMFMDIRNFTNFADSRTPKEVASFQNIVFSELINIVRNNKGIVVQILGDGIMAVFGAPVVYPTHVTDAVEAGHQMIKKVKNLGEEGAIPETKIGIGLHTGRVIAGEVGNEYRKFYSLTGTNVIIASRIEQLNKEFQSQFLVSEAVFDALPNKESSIIDHGKKELKGISDQIGIYQLA